MPDRVSWFLGSWGPLPDRLTAGNAPRPEISRLSPGLSSHDHDAAGNRYGGTKAATRMQTYIATAIPKPTHNIVAGPFPRPRIDSTANSRKPADLQTIAESNEASPSPFKRIRQAVYAPQDIYCCICINIQICGANVRSRFLPCWWHKGGRCTFVKIQIIFFFFSLFSCNAQWLDIFFQMQLLYSNVMYEHQNHRRRCPMAATLVLMVSETFYQSALNIQYVKLLINCVADHLTL